MKILNNKKYKFHCYECSSDILFSKEDCLVDRTHGDCWLNCPVCGREYDNQTYKIFRYEYIEEYDDKDKEIERLNHIINELEKELNKDFNTYLCKRTDCREVGKTYKAGANNYRLHIYLKLQELKWTVKPVDKIIGSSESEILWFDEMESDKNDIRYLENFVKEQDEKIEKLQNKNEELMTLYTTEREVKEDYKSIIKEVREYIEKDTRWFDSEYAKTYGELCTCAGANDTRLEVLVNPSNLLKILDKTN